MGVLIAMVDRAGQLGTHEADLVEVSKFTSFRWSCADFRLLTR
jgi:hypothetical protein